MDGATTARGRRDGDGRLRFQQAGDFCGKQRKSGRLRRVNRWRKIRNTDLSLDHRAGAVGDRSAWNHGHDSTRSRRVLSLANLSEVRTTYLRLRGVQRALNSTLFRTVSKKGMEESARALGFWQRGTFVLEEDDDRGVLMDFAIYEYRTNGHNAVERYAARSVAAEGSDERAVIEAMLKARFTLVEVEAVEPDVGARAVDRIFGEPFLLADLGLSQTAQPGTCIATRLLPFATFTMTSGTPLAFDAELAALFIDGLEDAFGDAHNVGMLGPKDRKELARNIIGLALGDPEETKVVWREKVAGGG